jgi:two-component system, OmpR family, response regulator
LRTPPRILVADDNPTNLEVLRVRLNAHGYEIVTAVDGEDALRSARELEPDLVLLDIMMPKLDGISVLKQLKGDTALPFIPVILVTARADTRDIVGGLEAGADDYLAKPFEPRELLARIRSVLRRSEALPPNREPVAATRMQFAGWTLDLTARHLVNAQNVIVVLSGAEFRLLKVFLEHPKRVLSRDQLLNLTQGRDADPFERSIDLQVSRVRQKLDEDARDPQLIKTVRNEGYVLSAEVKVETTP